MRILVTNDDGIHAPGLLAAEKIARALSDDVWVVAPETDQSGVVAFAVAERSAAPARGRRAALRRASGTPTDCVIMAVKHILAGEGPRPRHLRASTAARTSPRTSAIPAPSPAPWRRRILGIPAFALSQAYGPENRHTRFPTGPARRRRRPASSAPSCEEGVAHRASLVNINFPNCPPEQVRGAAVAVQGRRAQNLFSIEERRDGRQNPYFWLGFSREPFTPGNGTDLAALADKRIAVTPLRIDMTDEPTLTRYARLFERR
jgi:5'-nucleotidase